MRPESLKSDGLNQRISDDGEKSIGEILENINPATPEQTNIERYYTAGSDWAKGINLEHRIPIALSQYSKLGTSNPFYEILNSADNLSLVHRECHKSKTLNDLVIVKAIRLNIKKILTLHNLNRKTSSKIEFLRALATGLIELTNTPELNSETQDMFKTGTFNKLISIAESLQRADEKTSQNFLQGYRPTAFSKKSQNTKPFLTKKRDYTKIYKHRIANKKKLMDIRSRKINTGVRKSTGRS